MSLQHIKKAKVPNKHTTSRFNVDTTLFGRQQRCYNVELTSCAYWVCYEPATNKIESWSKDRHVVGSYLNCFDTKKNVVSYLFVTIIFSKDLDKCVGSF